MAHRHHVAAAGEDVGLAVDDPALLHVRGAQHDEQRLAVDLELRPLVRAVIACVLRERAEHADVEDGTNEALRRAFESERSARGPMRPWVLGIASAAATANFVIVGVLVIALALYEMRSVEEEA